MQNYDILHRVRIFLRKPRIINEAVWLTARFWDIVDLPSQDNSTTGGSSRLNPLHLANALAACVLSSRLTYTHRQWAIEQLVRSLSALAKDPPIGEKRNITVTISRLYFSILSLVTEYNKKICIFRIRDSCGLVGRPSTVSDIKTRGPPR